MKCGPNAHFVRAENMNISNYGLIVCHDEFNLINPFRELRLERAEGCTMKSVQVFTTLRNDTFLHLSSLTANPSRRRMSCSLSIMVGTEKLET